MELALTDDERRAIGTLKRLATRWPTSLWLFSASGNLNVMKKTQDGERALLGNPDYEFKGNEVDQEYVVATIDIENDGGDW